MILLSGKCTFCGFFEALLFFFFLFKLMFTLLWRKWCILVSLPLLQWPTLIEERKDYDFQLQKKNGQKTRQPISRLLKVLASNLKPSGVQREALWQGVSSCRHTLAHLVSKEHMTAWKGLVRKLCEVSVTVKARSPQSIQRASKWAWARRLATHGNNHVYSMRWEMWVTAIMIHLTHHVLCTDWNLK